MNARKLIMLVWLLAASAVGLAQTYIYDLRGQLTRVEYSAGNRLTITHDSAGNITSYSGVSTPFEGVRQTIPGRVHIERFDDGGEGIAYHDTDPVNSCNVALRAGEGVDFCFDGINATLGWTQVGEWIKYSVTVQESGAYSFVIWGGCPRPGGSGHIEIDGTNVTGPMMIPNTGSFSAFQPVRVHNIPLTAGNHVLRFVEDALGTGGDFGTVRAIDIVVPPSITQQPGSSYATVGENHTFVVTAAGTSPSYQWLFNGTNVTGATSALLVLTNLLPNQAGGYQVVCSNAAGAVTSAVANLFISQPYLGIRQSIPGRLRLERYDIGGEGVAYSDLDATNWGASFNGGFRVNEGVDTWGDGTTSGYWCLGATRANEWANYSVTVLNPGIYSIGVSAGNTQPGSVVHVEFDGANITGPLPVTDTHSWVVYKVTRKDGIWLPGGNHLLRLSMDQEGGGNGNGVGSINGVLVAGTPNISKAIISASNDTLSLEWDAVAGFEYRVQYATNLTSPTWSNLEPLIAATNSTASLNLPFANKPECYFRVLLPASD